MKITKLPTPKRGHIEHYFVASDWHSFYMCDDSYNCLISHAKLFPKKHRKLIINGDFLDCEHLMSRNPEYQAFTKSASGIEDFFLPESEAEFAWGNACLDELQKVFSEIVFISGNHDERYRYFRETKHCPSAYKHNFDLELQLKLRERGIKYVAYNDWLDIGDLSITHGMYHGTTHLKKHFEACNRSVLHGHLHQVACKSFVSRGKTKMAWSQPCMSKLNPLYLKNKSSNWSNGYATVHMRSNGHFNLYIHNVWDGEIILPDGRVL